MRLSKFGSNLDVDAAEDICSEGGNIHWPATAAATTVVSSSGDDDVGGTGATEIHVQGLDANWEIVTQTVTLTGAVAVTLPTPLLRCFRMWVTVSGSGNVNAGNVDCKHAANVVCRILADAGQSLTTGYTVPLDDHHVVIDCVASTVVRVSTTIGEAALMTRSNPAGGWRTRYRWGIGPTGQPHQVLVDLRPKDDVRIRVLDISVANSIVHGSFILTGVRMQ